MAFDIVLLEKDLTFSFIGQIARYAPSSTVILPSSKIQKSPRQNY